jgi:hypothetical protein
MPQTPTTDLAPGPYRVRASNAGEWEVAQWGLDRRWHFRGGSTLAQVAAVGDPVQAASAAQPVTDDQKSGERFLLLYRPGAGRPYWVTGKWDLLYNEGWLIGGDPPLCADMLISSRQITEYLPLPPVS